MDFFLIIYQVSLLEIKIFFQETPDKTAAPDQAQLQHIKK